MKLLPILLFAFFVSCSTSRDFTNKNVCFLVYDLKEKEFVSKINSSNCNKQLPAASTFKIPLSLMAFNEEILKDEKTSFEWDNKKRFLDAWNRDQTAESWMRESVVWVSQVMTPQIGEAKITKYLKDFNYGNADMSGGIKTAWLTPAPVSPEVKENSLKISGYEQVEFLEKLWKGKLPVSKHSLDMTKKILVYETNPPHRTLAGKTGSGFIDKQQTMRVGWYVAHLSVGDRDFIVVSNFTDSKEMPQPRGFGGFEARETAKQLLAEKDLW